MKTPTALETIEKLRDIYTDALCELSKNYPTYPEGEKKQQLAKKMEQVQEIVNDLTNASISMLKFNSSNPL